MPEKQKYRHRFRRFIILTMGVDGYRSMKVYLERKGYSYRRRYGS